jgi:O-antigen ligase
MDDAFTAAASRDGNASDWAGGRMSGIVTPAEIAAKSSYSSPAVPSSRWRALKKNSATKVIGLFLSMSLGLTVAIYPSSAGIALVTGSVLLLVLIQTNRMEIETWQTITLITLTGYVVLNYGFENLSVPVGPLRFLPVGELLMCTALVIAVLRHHGSAFRDALRDPSIICVLALLALTLIHLVLDLPENGLYALRDSTFSFEALFLLLGILWASRERNIELLTKWLMFLFIVTMAYSYSFPWAERLQDWSRISGPFHAVSLLGNYQDLAVYLVSGALFCIWVVPTVRKWPRWLLALLAIAQLAGLAILQSRTMYVGIALVLTLLFFLRETKRASQFLLVLASGLGALALTILLLSAVDWKVQGRLGPVNVSSLSNEVRSIWPSSAQSRELGHEADRRAWYGEVWNKLRLSPSHLLLGVGYGQPLIDFMSETGQPIRQPHNSTMNVFGRLGLLGLSIWLLFISGVLKRLWNGVREARKRGSVSCPLRLWLLVFSVLGLLDSMVQPYFEFSHSAVPFYFLMGVALGINPREDPKRATLRSSGLRLSLRAPERDGLRRLPW